MKPIKNKFILLFSPHPTRFGRRMIPLALVAVSTLIEKDYDVRIFHSYDKKDYLEALEHLDQAICVGITAMTGYQITDGLKFAKLVREKNKKVPIVWGGIHPTIKPLQTLEDPNVDIVVKGPGEETFAELVSALDQGKSLDGILGIAYKENGKIVNNPERPYRKIDSLPPMPYHILGDNIEEYIKINANADRNLLYLTSAGCPLRCRFCYLGNPNFERKWDFYPAQRVVSEIKNLVKEYNITGLEMRDSNFFVNKKRCEDIFKGLIEENIKISISYLNGRVDDLISFDDDFWLLMKKAGIREVVIGAESGDQEILDYIDKKIKAEDILECIKKAKKFGIKVFSSFMTGFPIQRGANPEKQLKQELDRTVDLASRMFAADPLSEIFIYFYSPYPGTYLYEKSLELGFNEPKSFAEWGKIDHEDHVTPWVTKNHQKKVELVRKLFVLKKLSSDEYFAKKVSSNRKIYWIAKFRLNKVLNRFVDFRFRTKFFFLPVENVLFSGSSLAKFIR